MYQTIYNWESTFTVSTVVTILSALVLSAAAVDLTMVVSLTWWFRCSLNCNADDTHPISFFNEVAFPRQREVHILVWRKVCLARLSICLFKCTETCQSATCHMSTSVLALLSQTLMEGVFAKNGLVRNFTGDSVLSSRLWLQSWLIHQLPYWRTLQG